MRLGLDVTGPDAAAPDAMAPSAAAPDAMAPTQNCPYCNGKDGAPAAVGKGRRPTLATLPAPAAINQQVAYVRELMERMAIRPTRVCIRVCI